MQYYSPFSRLSFAQPKFIFIFSSLSLLFLSFFYFFRSDRGLQTTCGDPLCERHSRTQQPEGLDSSSCLSSDCVETGERIHVNEWPGCCTDLWWTRARPRGTYTRRVMPHEDWLIGSPVEQTSLVHIIYTCMYIYIHIRELRVPWYFTWAPKSLRRRDAIIHRALLPASFVDVDSSNSNSLYSPLLSLCFFHCHTKWLI